MHILKESCKKNHNKLFTELKVDCSTMFVLIFLCLFNIMICIFTLSLSPLSLLFLPTETDDPDSPYSKYLLTAGRIQVTC